MNDRIKKQIEKQANLKYPANIKRDKLLDHGLNHVANEAFVQGAEWMLNSQLIHDRMILFAGYLQGKQSSGMTDVSVIMKEFKKDFNIN